MLYLDRQLMPHGTVQELDFAAGAAGGHDVRTRSLDTIDFFIRNLFRQRVVIDTENTRHAAAPVGVRHLYVSDPGNGLQNLARLCLDAQVAAVVTRVVPGDCLALYTGGRLVSRCRQF